MKRILIGVIGAIVVIFILLILLFDIILAVESSKDTEEVPSVMGYKFFIVMSGSMQTRINIGDLVIVKEIDQNTLKENDIIAFKDGKNFVTTHRIINVLNENGEICFETKGDFNNVKDNDIVYPKNVEGKMLVNIPKVGEFILFIQKPVGTFLMILIILLVVAIVFTLENMKSSEEKKKDEEYMKEFEEFKRQKMQENNRK